eukprot:TRINITY_DN392_c0_g1_i8.p1 TRINITY_DN392_c0_g1~~TRINITY_DN392_c0_g1_i8.p1  ORF type:complete len:995 (+),score=288.06 TRINITY_DN392_c0_g1_i8:53-3037(+)
MRCAALCALLCLPLAACGANAPIRVMGVVAASPPIAPHHKIYNPLVPCENITDVGEGCNKGGYPAMQTWMTNLSSDARGTVKFLSPDFRSRTVLAHPTGLKLNYAVWGNLGIDFVTMRNEHLLKSEYDRTAIESFIANSPYPWVMSDFVVDEAFPYLMELLSATHVKVVDGVKIGVLVLWSDTFTGRSGKSFPHQLIIPLLTKRLRAQGVDKIVVMRTDHPSTTEDEFMALTTYDIDVVVTDSVADRLSFVANDTAVLFSAEYQATSDYNLIVLDMVQDGGLWQYSLRDIGLYGTEPPAGRTDPVYIAAKEWAQAQVDLGASNDITVATSTDVMPETTDATGSRPCREKECHQGVLTADALRERAGAQIALANGGGVRGSGWAAGPIKRSNLWDTYPFANTVCRVNVSGTVLLDIINSGISQLGPDGKNSAENQGGRFPQISGLQFTMNPQLPAGGRVVSMDVAEADGTFVPLEKRRVYSVTVTSFMLGGGDGYVMIPANHQEGSSECFVTTMMEATQEYLMKRKTYAPYIDGRIAFDDNAVTIAMRNQSLSDCSELEKHDPYWQDCVACEAGFWRPDATSNVCVERVSDSVNVLMIAGIVVGIVVFLAIPLVWKMTEKQRRINALFNNNKVAEECAVAVMELRLSDLDYLNELERPNTIQSAFISIAKQMKMYMEFMPKNLIANYQSSDDDTESALSGSRSGRLPTSRHSASGSAARNSHDERTVSESRYHARRGVLAGAVKSNYARKKRVSVLALNSRSHSERCAALDAEGVRVLHSHLIENFNAIVDSFKGLAESMCGDRLLAAWNTVAERPSHGTLACKAAFQMRSMQEGNIVSHVGLTSGLAMFGLFGGTGTKKYDIVGKIVPGVMALALLNKQYDTQCLFPQKMVHDVSLSFYVRIVDYISHPKIAERSFLYELAQKKNVVAQDEWMYELESAEQGDPFKAHNIEWEKFIKTGEICSDPNRLNGKLLQLQGEGVPGKYCCMCPGLALM